MQKDILPFQYQLKKKTIVVKQLHTKQNLLILADLCKISYQTLQITCQKLIIKIAKNAWKDKKARSECEFIGLKDNILNYKCKECNETSGKSINNLIEKFPKTYKF